MPESTTRGADQSIVRLFELEVESWRPFLDALRQEDRQIARELIDECRKFAEAIESSGKTYLVEPFFLSILIAQEKRIKAVEAEMLQLEEMAESRRGSARTWHSSRFHRLRCRTWSASSGKRKTKRRCSMCGGKVSGKKATSKAHC